MGIIVPLAIFLVLGFMLAWITGMVANEEIEVKTGVIVVVLTGVATWAIGRYGTNLITDSFGFASIVNTAVWVVVMTGMLAAFAKIPMKKGVIIALIYAGIIGLLNWGMYSCAQSAMERHEAYEEQLKNRR